MSQFMASYLGAADRGWRGRVVPIAISGKVCIKEISAPPGYLFWDFSDSCVGNLGHLCAKLRRDDIVSWRGSVQYSLHKCFSLPTLDCPSSGAGGNMECTILWNQFFDYQCDLRTPRAICGIIQQCA